MNISGEKPNPTPLRPRRWADLSTRIASAVVLAAIAVLTAREGGAVFIYVWMMAGFAIHWEWQRLVGGASRNMRLAVGAFVLFVVAILTGRIELNWALLVLVAGAGGMAALAGRGSRIWAGAGLLYAGLLVIAVVSLRESFPFGARSIIWLFATVWGSDCFAYFGGRLIGGPKLWPRISPSKTWSGTICGIVFGGLTGTLVSVRDLPEPHRVLPILALSFAAATLSQAGDAFESWVKRHFRVKDSSNLIPGHGGFMDRLDGFIAAAIFAFAVGVIRNGPSVAGGLFYWA
jgi:phosphatidate cytidylyltransferase